MLSDSAPNKSRGNANVISMILALTLGGGMLVKMAPGFIQDVNESALKMVPSKVSAIHQTTTRYIDANCDNPLLPAGPLNLDTDDLVEGGFAIDAQSLSVRAGIAVAIQVINRDTRTPTYTYTLSGFEQAEAEFVANHSRIATELPDGTVVFNYNADTVSHSADVVSLQTMALFASDTCD